MQITDVPWKVEAFYDDGPNPLYPGGWRYRFLHPDGTVEVPPHQPLKLTARYALKAGKSAAKSRFSGRDLRIATAFDDLLEVYGTEGLTPIKSTP